MQGVGVNPNPGTPAGIPAFTPFCIPAFTPTPIFTPAFTPAFRPASFLNRLYICLHTVLHTCLHTVRYSVLHTCLHTSRHASLHTCIHTCRHVRLDTCLHTHDREAASSMVTAGATANTTEGNSCASRESGWLCSHSHVVKCLWEVFVWGFGELFLSCVCAGGVVLCRCVCDLLIFLHGESIAPA